MSARIRILEPPKLFLKFEYDGLNRPYGPYGRIRKVKYDANESEVSDAWFLWSGWQALEERNHNSSDAVLRRYAWGALGLYVAAEAAHTRTRAGSLRFVHTDLLRCAGQAGLAARRKLGVLRGAGQGVAGRPFGGGVSGGMRRHPPVWAVAPGTPCPQTAGGQGVAPRHRIMATPAWP